MEPMQPMKPMEPMEPMKGQEPWWPAGLGEPSTAGGQDDLKYAYFAERRRLAVARAGRVTVYDTGDHQITGVAQHRAGAGGDLSFSSPAGDVPLGKLEVAD